MPDRLEEIEQRWGHALSTTASGPDMHWLIAEVKRQRANSDHAVVVLHQALKEWDVKPAAQVWVRMAIAELEKVNPK